VFRKTVFAQGAQGNPEMQQLVAQPDLASLQQALKNSSAETRSAIEDERLADEDFERIFATVSELNARVSVSEALEAMRESGVRQQQSRDNAQRTKQAEREAKQRLDTAVNVGGAVDRLQAGVQAEVQAVVQAGVQEQQALLESIASHILTVPALGSKLPPPPNL
jgi:hypothetical protein